MKKKNQMTMQRVGTRDNKEVYAVGMGFTAGEALNLEEDTSTVFDEQCSGNVPTKDIMVGKKKLKYVMWGPDDQLPYWIRNRIGNCMITAQCQLFNSQTMFGKGLRFYDRNDVSKDANDERLEEFDMINNLKQTYMEMCVDMAYYYFAVVVFILDKEGKNIVRIQHKEAQNCRFTYDDKGRSEYIIYGNFENGADDTLPKELIPLLNINHPAEDFLIRTGRMPNAEGKKQATGEKKFAFVCRFPTVGFQFYPYISYFSIFRDKWYDMYQLIGFAKKTKIMNSAAPRYIIEIHREYWDELCANEGIFDPEKRKARIEQEKTNIEKFVCGIQNTGKTWITQAYTEPNGNRVPFVKVTNIETSKKEGGDWADDIQEASNVLCFALGVHPNLIGATPGKSQMNNSGSDKRELFTLKQTLMQPFKDMLLPPFKLLLKFNGYEGIGVEAPIVQLTTLDEHKDSKTVSTNNQEGGQE